MSSIIWKSIWSEEKGRFLTEEECAAVKRRVEGLKSDAENPARTLRFDENITQLKQRHSRVRVMELKERELEAVIRDAQQVIVDRTAELVEMRSRRSQEEQDLMKFFQALS